LPSSALDKLSVGSFFRIIFQLALHTTCLWKWLYVVSKNNVLACAKHFGGAVAQTRGIKVEHCFLCKMAATKLDGANVGCLTNAANKLLCSCMLLHLWMTLAQNL
jgi:hypothetical protein